MNPKHCLENIPNKNTANLHENIFNPFDFQYILNNNDNNRDISFFNDKYDAINMFLSSRGTLQSRKTS